MLFTEIIRTKRDGKALATEQIDFLVNGLADSSIPAEQVAAFAMAVYLNSMSREETGQLTMAMAASASPRFEAQCCKVRKMTTASNERREQ